MDSESVEQPVFESNGLTAGPFLPTATWEGQHLIFGFAIVTGASDGPHLITRFDARPVVYTVGRGDVTITAVYIPEAGFGSGKGGPGIWVDAFDMSTNDFSDEPQFVQVFMPPRSLNTAATDQANAVGEFSTAAGASVMRANRELADIRHSGFIWWLAVESRNRVSDQDVSLAQNATGEFWVAFYHNEGWPQPNERLIPTEAVWLFTGGGWKFRPPFPGNGTIVPPPPPGGEPKPFTEIASDMFNTLTILSIATAMPKELRKEAHHLASDYLKAIAEQIRLGDQKPGNTQAKELSGARVEETRQPK
jgi:hypothetical protein